MRVEKAVITAAHKDQRALPLQTLVDRNGRERSVLDILVEEVISTGIKDVCVVVWPGDGPRYAEAVGSNAGMVHFVDQPKPLGYADAIYCARDFTGSEPFLHLVSDHLWVSSMTKPVAHRLVRLAEEEGCAASAVQPTRENLLPRFGAVGGTRLPATQDVYHIHTVLEKPTPTEAEQRLIVSGLRAGYYLCFFGIHVLTGSVMQLLGESLRKRSNGPVTLSSVLAEHARRERYLALQADGRRYDLGSRYGLLNAQLALALKGNDRDLVLSQLIELLAEK